jgi:hypothetical protein
MLLQNDGETTEHNYTPFKNKETCIHQKLYEVLEEYRNTLTSNEDLHQFIAILLRTNILKQEGSIRNNETYRLSLNPEIFLKHEERIDHKKTLVNKDIQHIIHEYDIS